MLGEALVYVTIAYYYSHIS